MTTRAGSDEHYVLDLCDEILGIPGRRQQRFDWLRGDPSAKRPRGTELPVDGYGPIWDWSSSSRRSSIRSRRYSSTGARPSLGSAGASSAAATTSTSAPRFPNTGCGSS
ncbi:hypothetical protein ACJH6I_22590 [Mycobacterium sp. SMC-13]